MVQAEFGVSLSVELDLAKTEKLGYCDRCGENTYLAEIRAVSYTHLTLPTILLV